MQEMQKLGKVQYNTAGVADSAVAAQGVESFYGEEDKVWKKLLSERHQVTPDLRVVWKDGVSGADGIEGAWDLLCNGKVGASEALVYRVQRS